MPYSPNEIFHLFWMIEINGKEGVVWENRRKKQQKK